jgi:hypothetical protein
VQVQVRSPCRKFRFPATVFYVPGSPWNFITRNSKESNSKLYRYLENHIIWAKVNEFQDACAVCNEKFTNRTQKFQGEPGEPGTLCVIRLLCYGFRAVTPGVGSSSSRSSRSRFSSNSSMLCPCGLSQERVLDLDQRDRVPLLRGKCQNPLASGANGTCGQALGAHLLQIPFLSHKNLKQLLNFVRDRL